jgi:hypothetical protein
MPTIGQQLRKARETNEVDIREAAASTRIKVRQLEDLEADDYSKIPAPAYAKGFIRLYARFLGLDPQPLVDQYVNEVLNPPIPEEELAAAAAGGGKTSRRLVGGRRRWEQAAAKPATQPNVPQIRHPETPENIAVGQHPAPQSAASASAPASPAPRQSTQESTHSDMESRSIPMIPLMGGLVALTLLVGTVVGIRGCGNKNAATPEATLTIDNPVIADPPEPYLEIQ